MAATWVSVGFARLSRPSPAAWLQIGTAIGVWALWEAVARSGLVWHGAVPSSFAVLRALVELLTSHDFSYNLAVTLGEVAASVVVGGVLGLAVGLVLGANRFLGRAFEPYLHYIAPTPKIVFLPVIMLLAGVGTESKIALGTLSCFFPMALSIAVGVRRINPVLLLVGRSFNLRVTQQVRKIYLPALVPAIVVGLRLSFGLALVGCLLAELKMSNAGLGFLAMQAYSQMDLSTTYAIVLVVFAVAALGNIALGRIAVGHNAHGTIAARTVP